jgi:hypothetical protein
MVHRASEPAKAVIGQPAAEDASPVIQKISLWDFRGLRETDEIIDLWGPLIFRRDGVVYEVDELAPAPSKDAPIT